MFRFSLFLSESFIMPQILGHLAIIMDGNRRWACNLGIEVLKGHHHGADTLMNISQTAINQN